MKRQTMRRWRAVVVAIAIGILSMAMIGACSDSITVTLLAQPSDFRISRTGSTIAIIFSVSKATRVSLSIHDQSGGLVRSLVSNTQQSSGTMRRVIWNGRNDTNNVVAVGIYYVLLSVEAQRHLVPITVLQ